MLIYYWHVAGMQVQYGIANPELPLRQGMLELLKSDRLKTENRFKCNALMESFLNHHFDMVFVFYDWNAKQRAYQNYCKTCLHYNI